MWLQYALYANYLPVFKTPYNNPYIKVKLNGELNYTLPLAFDEENDIITISIIPHPTFISLTGYNLTIKPNASSEVGSYDLKVRLKDFQTIYSEYILSLEVTNTIPRFVGDLPKDQKVYLNEVLLYHLPKAVDDENNIISLLPIDIPLFIKIDGLLLTFTPSSVKDIGDH